LWLFAQRSGAVRWQHPGVPEWLRMDEMKQTSTEIALLENALVAIEKVLAHADTELQGTLYLGPTANLPLEALRTASLTDEQRFRASAAQNAVNICLSSAAALVDVSQALLNRRSDRSEPELEREWQALITHTKNDRAVGIAYPLASRIAGQNAAALGDQNDPYGGMGRNGAQNTAEADNVATMGLPGTRYSFKPGGIHNISSDLITGHSDVTRIEVAYALMSAVGAVE